MPREIKTKKRLRSRNDPQNLFESRHPHSLSGFFHFTAFLHLISLVFLANHWHRKISWNEMRSVHTVEVYSRKVTFVLAEARPKTEEGSRVQKLTRKRLLCTTSRGAYCFNHRLLLGCYAPYSGSGYVCYQLRYHQWWIGKPLGAFQESYVQIMSLTHVH